ncbi:quinol dehydrogenase ferredoxin subunit NapH [Solemya pervernicosa gill symbiont]|uniref:Quinol dehydrogenase ferredoxin subunit NapH n=2 Tax=Gammaproteobacteria incertae sedis TaxID=118884 RepID=A0A1T2L0H1_9GAMM|nr:quinol dehydrogenase ferredoxin subunit NapH [Candidatus Reidiella endopervernicosa]OOZ38599.1 quinol dehydrogenase ferredoxin subunit NapH [Solemya pervernicosa gill symbiont]QKQ24945.1 quinol dehydrogenase ferredoxin subunit NapH [Candidatus Reidiella endopervernicosa]
MAKYQRLGADALAEKGWLGAHKWLLLRRFSQLSILLLFMLGPWAGVWIIKGNLSSSLLLDTVPMTDLMVFLQMLAAGFLTPVSTVVTGVLIVTVFYLLAGGRLFCSWVCPLNMVTDAANWLREKLEIKPSTHLSRNLRYWMLAMVVVMAFVTGSMAYEVFNPVSMTHRTIIFGLGMGWAVVLAIFLFDLFVARRGWCSHLCPVGATYGLLGKLSLVRVRADQRVACNDCMECFVVCPEPQVIKPALRGETKGGGPVITSGDCTNCGRCIDICAKDVFHFGMRFNNVSGNEGIKGSATHA